LARLAIAASSLRFSKIHPRKTQLDSQCSFSPLLLSSDSGLLLQSVDFNASAELSHSLSQQARLGFRLHRCLAFSRLAADDFDPPLRHRLAPHLAGQALTRRLLFPVRPEGIYPLIEQTPAQFERMFPRWGVRKSGNITRRIGRLSLSFSPNESRYRMSVCASSL
jgi:hypothetical protein